MKILVIDTASKNCLVAIYEDEKKILERKNEEELTHSQKLMPLIDESLKKAKISIDDIELLICSQGPGSFTGVRIGISTAKAFEDVSNLKSKINENIVKDSNIEKIDNSRGNKKEEENKHKLKVIGVNSLESLAQNVGKRNCM